MGYGSGVGKGRGHTHGLGPCAFGSGVPSPCPIPGRTGPHPTGRSLAGRARLGGSVRPVPPGARRIEPADLVNQDIRFIPLGTRCGGPTPAPILSLPRHDFVGFGLDRRGPLTLTPARPSQEAPPIPAAPSCVSATT